MWTVQQNDVMGMRGRRYVLSLNERVASRRDFVDALQTETVFRTWLNLLLAECPYSAFRWETPPVSRKTIESPFEFVVLDAPTLERSADPSAFTEHLASETKDVATFANLKGDALLVVPAECGPRTSYGHLAAFVRGAPQRQRDALWQAVGEAIAERISDRPVWLSTAGAGVPWLHVRLDDQPKYYGHRPYRQML
jgi:hypothetical protein